MQTRDNHPFQGLRRQPREPAHSAHPLFPRLVYRPASADATAGVTAGDTDPDQTDEGLR